MDVITVKSATLDDIEQIRNIHRSCNDPWHDIDECMAWVEKRLNRNFYIQLGSYNNEIVGHGEWIISSEPDNRYLYLGMLQVDSNCQKKGVGRKLIEDGISYSRKNNCSYISVVCDEEDPIEFYRKCGFKENRKIMVSTLPTSYATKDDDFIPLDSVPEMVVENIPFRFGYAQASSRHMWEVCNQKPEIDKDRLTPAMKSGKNDFIQLSYFMENKNGIALCWSNSENLRKLINASLLLGESNGLEKVTFYYDSKLREHFNNSSSYCVELVLPLN